MSVHETSPKPGGSTYVLGHADVEVQRLLLQGRLYDDLTEHALRLAGLRPGMRVLDVVAGPAMCRLLPLVWWGRPEACAVWMRRPTSSRWLVVVPRSGACLW